MPWAWAWEGKCEKHRAGSVAQVSRDPTQNLFDRHNFRLKVDSVRFPWDEEISNLSPIPFCLQYALHLRQIQTISIFRVNRTQINKFRRKLYLFDQKSDQGIFRIIFEKTWFSDNCLRHGTEEKRGESAWIGLETNWSSRTREWNLKEVEKSWIWGQIRNWERQEKFHFLGDWLVVWEKRDLKKHLLWVTAEIKEFYRASSVISPRNSLEYHKRTFVTCSQPEQKVVSNRLVSPQILVVPTGWTNAASVHRVLLSNRFRWKICKSHEITTPHITLTSPGHESNWRYEGHSKMVYQIKIEKIYNQLVSMTGT